jgi:hypothetical protein
MTNSGMSHGEVTVVELVSVVFSCAAATVYIWSGFTVRVVVLAVVVVAFVAGGIWVSRREGVMAS